MVYFCGVQSIELTNDFGLLTSMARYRTLDPQTARWWQIDPEVEAFYAWSPYHSNLGNPVRYEDRDGDFPWLPIIVGIGMWLASEPAVAPTNNPQADKAAVDKARAEHDKQITVVAALAPIAKIPQMLISTASAANKKNNTTGNGSNFTRKEKQKVIDVNKSKNDGQVKCENCGVVTTKPSKSERGITPPKTDRQVDHIYPKSKGGEGKAENGQVLCRDCNRTKSDKVETNPKK